jgi:hypothetical protein
MAVTVIPDLAVLLEGLGYLNVQRYVLQDTPDACVAITAHDTSTGRGKSEFVFGQEAPVRGTFRLLVTVRGAVETPDEPGVRAFAIWKALHKQLATINGSVYRKVVPLQTPQWLKQDARRRHLYVFHVEVVPNAI